jgi:hypothetical protein
MSDNYLWDKEVQHLESLLREFRYQPRPLVLPEAAPKRRLFSFPTLRFAALAAVALLALGVGIWLSGRTATNAPAVATSTATPTPTATPEQLPAPAPQVAPPAPAPRLVRHAPKAHFAKHSPKRASRKSLEAEGERAKEKVLYALQITSQKLNLIAKKVQADTN